MIRLSGQPYLVYEGSVLDTVLMNRLDGDAAGPVKVLVSNPLYSHDHQHVIIPEGTVVLGEAKKIGAAGFGQQRRMAVVFHRLIMPDGYSVDLDQFHGLDQIGEEGLKDKVNNHYFEIFGASIALGVIAGAGEIDAGRRHDLDQWLPGFYHWHRGQRLAVGKHHPGPLHADTADHHDSGGASREDLLHAGYALACVYATTPYHRRFEEVFNEVHLFPCRCSAGFHPCIHRLQEAGTVRRWRYTGSLQRLCRSALQIRHIRRSLPRRRKRRHENKRRDHSTATSGAADGLNYDSSKAAQKPAPKQPPKQ